MDDSRTSSRRRRRAARHAWSAVAALALSLVLPGTAPAHGTVAIQESKLRDLETRLLGAAHAAEHAAARAAARRSRGKARANPARRLALVPAGPPEAVGAWDGPPRTITRNGLADQSLTAIHALLLPTGKVLFFGPPLGPRVPRAGESVAVLWDPVTRSFEYVPPPLDPRTGKRANIYCSSATLMADGRVLVVGGYLDFDESPGNVNNKGLNHTWTFDPWTKAWQRHENQGGGTDPMSTAGGRWYPSQVLMADGRTLIVLGINETGTRLNRTAEVFDPGKPLGDELDVAAAALPSPGGNDAGIYPHVWWMPTGRALVVGPSKNLAWMLQPTARLTFSLREATRPSAERTWGTGVMLPLGFDAGAARLWRIGGASHPNNDADPANDIQASTPNFPWRRAPAVRTTEGYDEASDRWTDGPSLNVPRAHHNTVLLPDGGMVTIGGGTGGDRLWATDPGDAERQVELFDGSRWITGPPQAEGRAYHSTALLLPDGSVVSAGDDNPYPDDTNPNLDTYEVYKPPYFFRGPRPVITSAPAAMVYGATITVGSPNADVTRALLVAPGAVTHAVDMAQRVVTLPVARRADGTGYDVRTPLNANVAVPGHYMLFLVDGQNRPSVAAWTALGTQPRPGGGVVPQQPTAPAPPAVAPPAGRSPRPRVTARLRSRRLAALRRARRLVLRVGIGQPGSARIKARLIRVRGRQRTAIARWRRQVRFRTARPVRVALPLRPAQRRRMRGDVRLSVRVRARAATGRRATRTVSIRLR